MLIRQANFKSMFWTWLKSFSCFRGRTRRPRVFNGFYAVFQCGSFEKVRNLQLKITSNVFKKTHLRKQISQLKSSNRSNDVIQLLKEYQLVSIYKLVGLVTKYISQYTYIYMINSICISLHLCIMFVRFLFVCIL